MQVLFTIYLFILGINALYGLVCFKKLTSPFRILVLLLIFLFLMECSTHFILPKFFKNILPFYHFIALIILSVSPFIFIQLVQFSQRIKRWIIGLALLCFSFALYNTFIYQGLTVFPSFSIAAQAFLSIFLALVTFKVMLEKPSQTPLLQEATFWLTLGTLFFHCITFVLFVFYNEYYDYNRELIFWTFSINVVSNLLLYSTYLIAIYLNQKTFHER
jgi:hypothetical protein